MADSTLNAVRVKVRRLTRSPSDAQITDAQIDEYINTFVQYDFPEHLRLFNLRQTFTFYTSANIDTYTTNSVPGDPLDDFKQIYLTVHDPVYVAGYQVQLSQNRNEFFGWWPFNNDIRQVGTGDGVTFTFTGTLPAIPILRNYVTFTAINANNVSFNLHDDGNGNIVGDVGVGPNIIDYITGIFVITFASPPAQSQPIWAETVPYQASRPTSMLFFQDTFTLRPVPDKGYPVQFEVYRRPTELLAINQSPELQEWWQYIAYGAAKKVFEDRSDSDSVDQIMPEFKQQENLILRRTIVQQTKERTATIYVDALQGVNASYNWGQGGF